MAHQGRVIDRRQRRALPARGHVGLAQVVDHRNPKLGRQKVRVAQLDGPADPAAGGPLVKHGLSVKADQVDVGAVQPVGFHEAAGGGGMLLGDGLGGVGEHRRLRRVARPGQGLAHGFQHQFAGLMRQLLLAGGAEGLDGLPVRLQHRHVHRVQRCAAHEPQDAHASPFEHKATLGGRALTDKTGAVSKPPMTRRAHLRSRYYRSPF